MARRLDPSGVEVETTRREFLQVMIAGSSLMIGGVFLTREEAAALPGPGNTSDVADIGDSLIAVETPYKYNLTLEVTPHNRVRFELPREDKGQGIATALAMMIAEEMDADYDRVDVELSDRRAIGHDAHGRLVDDPHDVGALAHGRGERAPAPRHRRGGALEGLSHRDHGEEVAGHARSDRSRRELRRALRRGRRARDPGRAAAAQAARRLHDHRHAARRKNARAIVTGAQKYTLDSRVADGVPANAKPAVVLARPPERSRAAWRQLTSAGAAGRHRLRGDPLPSAAGRDGCRLSPVDRRRVSRPARMPRSSTPQARDALAPLVDWEPGPLAGTSERGHPQRARVADPRAVPGPGLESLDLTFDFPYVAHAPLEVMNAWPTSVGLGDDLVSVAGAELSGGTDRHRDRRRRREHHPAHPVRGRGVRPAPVRRVGGRGGADRPGPSGCRSGCSGRATTTCATGASGR
jgi:isoquinoline 1-oxidoreductase beta subunit